ncbi:hypothetical protein ACLOJK_001927 [Asimina triloba]
MQRFLLLVFLFLLSLSLSAKTAQGNARTQTVSNTCNKQLEHNATIYVPNFVATMENISTQILTADYGVSIVGSGLDTSYGLAQCYGDLSSLDCTLCYVEARTVLPKCYPFNGGRIYLDGCFMRAENYSFFDEYLGPGDTVVCGNATRKGQQFVESARRAVLQAAGAAPGSSGYATAAVPVDGTVNQSAHVLANCWRTLQPASCKACLENASAAITSCLPGAEGRALNTGCFLRYSDTDFLNPQPSSNNGRSRGKVTVTVVAISSCVAVALVGIGIGLYILKGRRIQRKRKGDQGTYEALKMASILRNSSLNFKYSTLEKATGSFDIANKLGQGGFGSVYKGVLADGREVAVKRLFFNNIRRVADFYNEQCRAQESGQVAGL